MEAGLTVYTDIVWSQSETKGLQNKHFPHAWTVITVLNTDRSISKSNLLNNINRITDPGKREQQQTGKCATPSNKSRPLRLTGSWHFSNCSFVLHMHITSWTAVKFLPSSSTNPFSRSHKIPSSTAIAMSLCPRFFLPAFSHYHLSKSNLS